jgi:hypothetical protein
VSIRVHSWLNFLFFLKRPNSWDIVGLHGRLWDFMVAGRRRSARAAPQIARSASAFPAHPVVPKFDEGGSPHITRWPQASTFVQFVSHIF